MKNLSVICFIVIFTVFCDFCEVYSQTNSGRRRTPAPTATDLRTVEDSSPDRKVRFGFLTDPQGVVPDSKCAECHPRQVRLMHKRLTGAGKAKTSELTQGMINLAVECRPDGKGSFTCQPQTDAQCFKCHAVSASAAVLSLIDLKEMKEKKKENEILGHGCLTCHPPRRLKKHHLTGNIQDITIRASQAFQNGCRGCHAEGLAKITGGGSPHDWLARHLEAQKSKAERTSQ